MILFAGFYIEATLNHIFEETGKEKELKHFPISSQSNKGKNQLGLRDKLVWFYNEFINQTKAKNWKDLNNSDLDDKLNNIFSGFLDLQNFRNDISHGHINKSAKSVEKSLQLRQQAKEIVEQLYATLYAKEYSISRDTSYLDALISIDKNKYAHVEISSSS